VEAITREEKIISGENLTPITRKEMFLAKASGQNIQTPTPITREEYFLSKITGGGGSPAIVEGTAIPVGAPVDTIYFNANLSNEQIDAYLSQLTYTDIGFGNPVSLLYAQTSDYNSGIFLFVSQGYDGYAVLCWNTISNQYGAIMYSSTVGIPNEQYNTEHSKVSIPYVQYDITCEEPVIIDFMGLPIGAENKKIKNVLSITPFGASATSGASAYTVSSVDELPSNAVDGSMAIVESDSEWLGVWEFKNELTREDAVWGSADGGYSSLMTSCKTQDGFEVRRMSFPETYDGVYTLQYQGESEHQIRSAYRTDELWGMSKGWLDENNKILTLLKEFQGSNGMTAWWKSNAVRTVAHKLKTLYIRENGEWVYKSEVV
jgi:hypothetical protein